jgi:hypothetical protein
VIYPFIALVQFSLILAEPPLADPRHATRMVAEIEGLGRTPPSGGRQQCERRADVRGWEN